MNWKKYILVILSLASLFTFAYLKGSIIDGNCGGSDVECRALGKYADYLWRFRDFSLAMFAVGILNLMKPIANRALLIITALFAVVTAIAVFSAPAISGSFLSPFDKKFVGQICVWGYVLISVAVWARAVLKTRKISI